MRLRLAALLLLAAAAGCRSEPPAPDPAAAAPRAPTSTRLSPLEPGEAAHWALVGWGSYSDQSGPPDFGPALIVGDPPRLAPLRTADGRPLAPLGWSAVGEWLAGTVAGPDGEPELCVMDHPSREAWVVPIDANLTGQPDPCVFDWAPVGSAFAMVDGDLQLYIWGVANLVAWAAALTLWGIAISAYRRRP